MAQISTDNGRSYCTAGEALAAYALDLWVELMDDDVREDIHNSLAPCSDLDFLEAYLAQASHDLVIG